jgi:hypothetical protein
LVEWLTAVVVAILESKFAGLEEDFYMIAGKAKRYLKKKNLEAYLKMAAEFVKSLNL